MNLINSVFTFIVVHCVAVSPPDNFQATVFDEVVHMIGDSAKYVCDQRRGIVLQRMCSCDRNCNRYGDCCIDIARDEQRQRFVCARLQRHGRHVWMKASCTGQGTSSPAKFKCQEQFTNDVHALSYIVDVPAFYERTLYRNVYCVLCNKGRLDDIYWWHGRMEWIGQPPPNTTPDKLFRNMIYDVQRRVYFVEHEGTVYNTTFRAEEFKWTNFTRVFNTTECIPVVGTCPEESDPVLARKCELYAAYYTPNNTVQVSYKNYHCALCNGVPLATIQEDYKHGQPFVQPSFFEGVFSLDVPQLASGSYFQFVFDPSIAGSGCDEDEVRVPGLNSCHPFMCPEGMTWERTDGCVGPGGSRSCPWVVFEEQWVTILPNRSLYLNFSHDIVGPDDYESDVWEGHVLVCVQNPVTIVLDPTQEIMAEVCLAVSTACLLLLVAVYIALPHLRARAAGSAVVCLSMSLALAQALFLAGNDIPPHTTACHLVAVVVHYCYLASFFWMNALAIDVCRSLAAHVFDSGSEHLFLWYSGYAWVSPMVIVAVGVLLDAFLPEAWLSPNYGGNVCWICSRAGLIAFFLFPVATLLLANAVLLALTARSLRAARLSVAANRRDDRGIPFLLYTKLVLAFGLTWVFGFAAALTPARWLWYPFIVMSGLQGAFLFLAFACKKNVFRDLRQRFSSKKKKKQTPEASSQATLSSAAQPLVLRVRHPVENSGKKVADATESKF